MLRRILMPLLLVGAVLGFANGFAHSHERWDAHHAAFERHVADLCVDAARSELHKAPPAPTLQPPAGDGNVP